MIADPTHTKALRGKFARALRTLYKKRLRNIIEALNALYLWEQASFSPDDVNIRIDREFGTSFEMEAEKIIKLNLPRAYEQGLRRALTHLRREGVDVGTITGYTAKDMEAMAILNANGLELCKSLAADAKKKTKLIISESYLRGESISKISRRIRTEVAPLTRQRADMIARTETIRAYNRAALNQYERYGVKKFVWIFAGGERSCPTCEEREGAIYEVGEVDEPPIHPNCRCTIYPVVE